MSLPLFRVGQLVQHKHYGYRGVIAAFDETCMAADEWYRSNRTQPDRNQPWYHVLVHGSEVTTYAAEENLLPDQGGKQVIHPLVHQLFASFQQGQYAVSE